MHLPLFCAMQRGPSRQQLCWQAGIARAGCLHSLLILLLIVIILPILIILVAAITAVPIPAAAAVAVRAQWLTQQLTPAGSALAGAVVPGGMLAGAALVGMLN